MVLRLFLSFIVLFIHCPSDAYGSLTPIEPASDLIFQLKIGGKVVGIIQGNVRFNVLIENKTEQFSFSNATGFVVTGSQTNERTVFIINGKDARSGHDLGWSVTFDNSKSVVKLVESSLSSYGLNLTNVNVTWNDPVQLAASSNAYKCSSIKLSNRNGDLLIIKDAKIQPFVTNGTFGQDVLCPQDQPAPPKPGDWTVTQNGTPNGTADTYTCIKMNSFIYLSIDYATTNGSNATAVVPVPYNASVKTGAGLSTCEYNFATAAVGDKQILQLIFPVGVSRYDWTLTFTFTNNKTYTGDSNGKNVVVYLVSLIYYTDPSIFVNTGERLGYMTVQNDVNPINGSGSLKMFAAANDHSYRCNANETTVVTSNFSVETESLRVEAFLQNSTTLLTEHVCPPDQKQETSDLIPIIIGAALAALVVVVLVAYLIGRARARGSNYETI